MKSYIITIIGAALLAAAWGILAPEKWKGYVQIITGLVIISCIISPLASIMKTDMSDIFSGFEGVSAFEDDENNDLQGDIIKAELKKRIDNDIEERMQNEYKLNISADCDIRVNDDGEIEGVDSIRITGGKLSDSAKKRLCEVYGVRQVYND